ncbi:hypothetical protein HanXRQr2_Chr08g0358691 [Helianthus annuus]|uniref:Putative plant transposon protein domain-containing protein n=1 Tax=Helianthus annuus TaxID=4232 RepID=A0A9K3IIB5_HELAN|nr:hypothetical protein HanXRQr2_Chr08g0358691 [Helianthus annuus]KAJ0540255.1 hypothetical protein HanHA300_Chr08g0296141 [Helianthus annuus]KAJ0548749.1 hypothetical protein HanIR_Chr08g0387271 [Helianthus annuus]KAJ0555000.1 hypothetical protein HanHA89_Chr08g0314661 [Helianthus annuus]KAJ0720568.1 hypothetical protein HanLR1_Chr08g0295021 [Helianthus annuus]
MVKELILEGKVAGMKRENLKLPARLLLSIVQQNVLPRRSDRSNLRKPDVPILYYLLKGKPRISYKYLVMMNIWTSRNKLDKILIPHCRLITALLKKRGVINETSAFIKLPKGHTTFTLDGFNNQNGLEYVRTERYHKLKASGWKWRALRTDARMLLPGEEDESESDDSVMGDSDGEDAEDVATGFDVGTSSGVPDVEDVMSSLSGRGMRIGVVGLTLLKYCTISSPALVSNKKGTAIEMSCGIEFMHIMSKRRSMTGI